MASPDLPPGAENRDTERPPGDEPGRDGVTARALDRFMRALDRIGPIAPGELDLLIARFGPEGTEALTRELVRTGRLTARQAAAVLTGEGGGPMNDGTDPEPRPPGAPEPATIDPVAGGTVKAPGAAPRSRPVVAVAAAVLAMTAAAVVLDGRRVQTGELLVQAEGGDVRVTIRQAGRLIVFPSEKRSFSLLPGVYDVELDGPVPGLPGSRLRYEVPRIAVTRHKRSVVRLSRPNPPATIPGPTYPLDPIIDRDATSPGSRRSPTP